MPDSAATGVTVLRGVRLLDGTGADPLEDAAVVVEGAQVRYAGPASGMGALPQGADEIPLGGRTLLPGLINSHVHLTVSETSVERPLPPTPTETEYQTLLKAAQRARACLERGVTTVRDVGATSFSIFALRDAIQQGAIMGSRIFAAGKLLCMTGGHAYQIGQEADGPDSMRRAAREQIRAGADLLKLMADGGTSDGALDIGDLSLFEDEISAAVDVAHRLGLRVTCHAIANRVIHAALDLGVDCIEHGYALDSAAVDKLLANGTYLVPTLQVSEMNVRHGPGYGLPEWRMRQSRMVRESARSGLPEAIRRGVKIAAGTDGGSPFNPHFEMVTELELMVELGMTPSQALQSATRVAAECLGVEGRLGTLAEGKLADLVVVDGDLLQSLDALRRPVLVMKDGRVFVDRLS